MDPIDQPGPSTEGGEPGPGDDERAGPVARPTGPALLRLIAEVRDGEGPRFGAYNRTYHRHNR